MNRRKFLLGSAATLSGSGLLVGTQGYSRVEADRGATVNVIGDDDAYLRFDYSEPSDPFPCGTTSFTLLDEIRNQTTEPLTTVTLKIKHVPDNDIILRKDGTRIRAGDTVDIVDADGPEDDDALGIGQQTDVELKTVCNGGVTGSGPLRFDLEVEGEDTVVETERPEEVSIGCDCPLQVDGVRFMGQGNAEILTHPPEAVFEENFDVWLLDKGGTLYQRKRTSLETNTNLRKQLRGIANRSIVAVALADEDQWYRYPHFQPDTCSLDTPTPEEKVFTKEPIDEC